MLNKVNYECITSLVEQHSFDSPFEDNKVFKCWRLLKTANVGIFWCFCLFNWWIIITLHKLIFYHNKLSQKWIWIFDFWHFTPIFVLLRIYLSGNNVWLQASFFQKLAIFWHFLWTFVHFFEKNSDWFLRPKIQCNCRVT